MNHAGLLPSDVAAKVMGHLRRQSEPTGRYGVHNLADLRLRCVMGGEGTSCWHWRQAADKHDGTPKLWLPAIEKIVTGPYAAATLSGRQPQRGQMAFRLCYCDDCVNPMHVTVGTRAEAGVHRARGDRLKGDPSRSALNASNARARSKITPEIVREIRSSPETGVEIAKRLGLTSSNVSYIRCNKGWREVIPASSVFAFAQRGGV